MGEYRIQIVNGKGLPTKSIELEVESFGQLMDVMTRMGIPDHTARTEAYREKEKHTYSEMNQKTADKIVAAMEEAEEDDGFPPPRKSVTHFVFAPGLPYVCGHMFAHDRKSPNREEVTCPACTRLLEVMKQQNLASEKPTKEQREFMSEDDRRIWQEVFRGNEYKLQQMKGAKVLDIGAHTGAFTALCLTLGAAYVEAYEPCAGTAEQWYKNTADIRAAFFQVAVTDKYGREYLKYGQDPHSPAAWECLNTLCDKSAGPGEYVFTIPFKEIMVWNNWDLVKLDCEGSEYAILNSVGIEHLRQAREYVIESHDPKRHKEIDDIMKAAGFTWKRKEDKDMGFQITWYERTN